MKSKVLALFFDTLTMEDTRTNLGAKLKHAREEAHIKQKQVAHFLNISVSAVSAMESGQRKIDALELYELSKLYGKPLDWFFDNEHPLSARHGVRWYDNDPLIREVIFLMEKAHPDLRKKAAYGVLGFLSDS